jgi:hypothetical protein
MPNQPIIVFDVNETLLDLETIRPVFDRLFDDPAAMRLWFAGLITYSEALTLARIYVPFTEIGAAVLRMLAATRGIAIAAADAAELTERFASMPPHPEVPAALRRLRRSRGHLPDCLPRLGHAGCPRSRLAGRSHSPSGERPARGRPSAELRRERPGRGCRPADRPLPGGRCDRVGGRVMPVTHIAIRDGKPQTVAAKLAMYRRIVERLGSNPGVRPEDVLISVVESPVENWSFGNGETQFYEPDDRDGPARLPDT